MEILCGADIAYCLEPNLKFKSNHQGVWRHSSDDSQGTISNSLAWMEKILFELTLWKSQWVEWGMNYVWREKFSVILPNGSFYII